MSRRPIAILLFILAVALLSGGVWWVSFTTALQPIADRGRADLSLAADRLVGELQRFRQVAVLLADHPDLAPLLAQGQGQARARSVLLRTSDKVGTLEILLADAEGAVLASSSDAPTASVTGQPHFQRAMQGAIGSYHTRLNETGQRVFSFAVPVFVGGEVAGAVIVDVDMEAVEESDWRGDPQAIYFTDEAGVVFVSNRSELLLRRQSGAGALPPAALGYLPSTLQPFFSHRALRIGDLELWFVDAGRYIPARALHFSQPLPVIGMTGEVLISTAQAERIAGLQAAFAAALSFAFGALLFLAAERRRALSEKLEIEARANAVLEARVEARTRELSDVNRSLRREIAEREEAEAALKKAQADLVQAGKLSALGKMSAGISHELNQPLMAIQNFAANAETFLERGNTEVAASNLARISDLARRMGRIIKNLRAFARQESEPISDVDIVSVVDAALEVAHARLHQLGVTVDWAPPPAPVKVRGGEVRLQQVVLNLVSNAADAMERAPEKRLLIELAREGGKVRLTVRDTGPGIDDPGKIFDPFYSTKEVGHSEGMGLGLSISYGLVQSFGGEIRGRNHPEGGAVFTVELTASGMEQVA
ncbi:C4-dicarboxylate transport sensor protein DctB [Pseudoruegeria aquimaris]|uniref:C4-dicarboxylate transport sensor protein DctB n=1 Tax=Pseudoruegeria aquimaris TaxID=393663 RepID=A0A1Y5RUD9_9RHOB|nr:ATP-binding protein [Pseudoruegeria aquimaris]SLN22949.1 C4-dicarboxylate transport sensor protein DctB [Pseudoruegeria aquimaris]